ncbi:MAG: LAGLIDADG family homing endonuclease [Candidatus Nanoarchaeia archaeon]
MKFFGEGCFNIRINPNKNRRAKIETRFSLKLRHQDKDILDELQRFFQCGNVYIQRDKRKNHSLCYRFEVQNKKEIIEKIIPFFEKYPPKIKSRINDFRLFKEILKLSNQEEIDFEKIKVLKEKMHWGSPSTGKLYARWERQVA